MEIQSSLERLNSYSFTNMKHLRVGAEPSDGSTVRSKIEILK
ncbi:uncharacterized protein G2W53_036308 [Senna tora]|uniref:Uncharacterized protein n=1 Tax=Senna tora TaxID=362788 RepID=A0A834SVN0_9FABA|nr:uncharacterized protein G2W53_036308 [Senna tora]